MRIYHTGIGKPPFEFEYDGQAYVCYPSDKKWVKTEEEYIPESTARSRFPAYKRYVWKEAEGHPKPNFLDVNADQAKYLRLSKYMVQMRELGVVFEENLKSSLDKQVDAKMEEHRKRLEAIEQMSLEEVKAAKRPVGRPPKSAGL